MHDQGPEDVTSQFTIEVTSSAFRVDDQGFLQVALANLDRDPPNPSTLTFQAVARHKQGLATSSPVSVSVHLIDVNDNAPKFAPMRTVTVPAGDSRHLITQVTSPPRPDQLLSTLNY